jgi:hypothetical protein
MRLRKEMIEYLSKKIIESLLEKKMLEVKANKEKMAGTVNQVITDDLMVEDKLNEEVRELLSHHIDEVYKGNVDYSRMFNMIKTKLAKERGLIL